MTEATMRDLRSGNWPEGYELRYVPCEFRVEEADGKRKIVGYAAVFDRDSVDFGGWVERIQRGAFADTIKRDDVRALVEHDPRWIIGRNVAKTLELAEDEKGLRMSIDTADTTAGRDIVESVKRGDVSQASFGFSIPKDGGVAWHAREDGVMVRTLLKVRLYDVSPVAFPAYPDTSVGLRSLEAWRKDHAAPARAIAAAARAREIELLEAS